jgi:hypothetical protein
MLIPSPMFSQSQTEIEDFGKRYGFKVSISKLLVGIGELILF